MTMQIRFEDISVVVQGPIQGSAAEPLALRSTFRCLQSIRAFLPGSEIILSTWKGCDLSGLEYDFLVESDDPGAAEFQWGNQTHRNNVNRQITSTSSGLKAATRSYAMKLRSDCILTGTGFLNWFGKFNTRATDWKILRDRVLTATVYSRDPHGVFPYPFHPSDWFHFGHLEDLLKIWDIPLEAESSRWFHIKAQVQPNLPEAIYRYTPEQYIWSTFLKKYDNLPFNYQWDCFDGNISLSELTIANNLVLVEPEKLNLLVEKYTPNKTDWASIYTHNDWLRLYHRHCLGRWWIPPSPSAILRRLCVPIVRKKKMLRYPGKKESANMGITS